MSTTRSPLSSWICDRLPGQEPVEEPPSSAPPPSTTLIRPLEALSRREPSEAPPPSSTLPLGYRQSRSSGARVMLGITANPWKKRG